MNKQSLFYAVLRARNRLVTGQTIYEFVWSPKLAAPLWACGSAGMSPKQVRLSLCREGQDSNIGTS